MLIHIFLSLAIFDRAEYVRRNGVYLMCRLEDIYLYKLFEMDGYFVEIKFNYKEDYIQSVEAFHSTEKLLPFLNHVDVDLS
jgi:hypothetical protein